MKDLTEVSDDLNAKTSSLCDRKRRKGKVLRGHTSDASSGISTQYFSLPSFSITQTRHLHIQVIACLCFVDATGSGETYEEAKANATKALLSKLSKLAADDLRRLIYEEREANDGLILEIEEIIQIPQKLLRKHILSTNFTIQKNGARKLSYQRSKLGNAIHINTVFENTDSLLKCRLSDGSKSIIISKRPLNTYQCIKKNGKWTQIHLGGKWAIFGIPQENYHFSSSMLAINNVIFDSRK